MKPYGCYNRIIGTGYYVKVRKYDGDRYELIDKFIPHTMTTHCQYDRRAGDERCNGCRHTS